MNARKIIYETMQWSKATVPALALAAAVVSGVRTVQTVAEIYTASGSASWAVYIVAGAVAFSVEGAIYLLALAQESQQMKWRLARKKRHVASLATLWHGIQVRLGFREPLSYDQMPESDGGISILLRIAFFAAIVTNLYLGMKPLWTESNSSSIQNFILNLLNANADIQMRFVVDLTLALFPPFMERTAGHLASRFAAEVASSVNKPVEKRQRVQKAPEVNVLEQTVQPFKKGPTERVIEYLNEHPEAFDGMSQNKIAKEVGASVGTVNAVFKSMKAPEQIEPSSNGRH